MAILLSAFSIPALAGNDNAQSGDGETSDATKGYAYYNPAQFLWKVTLFAGKSDQVSKQDSLTDDFYQIGTVIIKKTGWSVPTGTKFANGIKVDYYDGMAMDIDSSPYIISDANCPAVPITSGGSINRVKSYFGSTGTMSTVLNGIAEDKQTTKEEMLSKLSFTIGGRTKNGWDFEYVAPNATTNRIPWVVVYEPIVILNLKDKTTKLAFTATEYALCEINGWYDFNWSNGKGQNCASFVEKHLPTSVQLEESWFGYPVYAVTDDSVRWKHEDIVKGGGWGMRWLPVAVKEPQASQIDYGCSFGPVNSSPSVGGYGSVQMIFTNYKSETGTVLCELYRGSTLVWSSQKTIEGGSTIRTTVSLRYTSTATQTLTCRINWSNRATETDPSDNMDTTSVTPLKLSVTPSLDYGVFFRDVEQPEQDSYGLVEVGWKNWTNNSGTALCELYVNGALVWSETKIFEAYGNIDSRFQVYYAGTSSHTLEARINWAKRNTEVDPSDNHAVEIVTPTQTKDNTYDFSVSDLTLSPTTIFQGNACTVSFVSDNWNHDVAYEDILVEVLVDGEVVKSRSLDYKPFGRYRHTYTIPMENEGTSTVTARINWANRNAEDNRDNNRVSKSVEVKKYYEFSASNLQITPTACYEQDAVKVTFRTDNRDRYHAYEGVSVELLVNDTVVTSKRLDYSANSGYNHTWYINVGARTGVNTIKARVNWANRTLEVNAGNNSTEAVELTVREKRDLTIKAIAPNSPYRTGTTVISSFNIINNSRHDVLPEHNNTVTFESYYYDGDTKVVISSQTWNQAVVPAQEKSLVYFKWTVPDDIAGMKVYCTATVNADYTIEEYTATNNTDRLALIVVDKLYSQTPDTQFEKNKPNGFTIPAVPSARVGKATWTMWVYENGAFAQKKYGIAISSTAPTIRPDEGSPSAEYVNGYWQMRSGYGFCVGYRPKLTGIAGYLVPAGSAYTSVQQAYVAFPEYKYSTSISCFRTLQKVGDIWRFEANPYADECERLHFTPLWYPNGEYTVSVTASEVWTPVGMLTTVRNSNVIHIVDSAYDDWYVGEQ
jgi:hypothetical protein